MASRPISSVSYTHLGVYKRQDAEIIERFAGLDRAQGEELGLEVSVKAAQAAAPYADGFYLMTPFNRIALMLSLIHISGCHSCSSRFRFCFG